MPGRPYRHKILDHFGKPVPRQLSDQEWEALLEAQRLGICKRLQRVAPDEARAAASAMKVAKVLFAFFSESQGIEKAKNVAAYIISEFSENRAGDVFDSITKHPLVILMTYKEFLDGLSYSSDIKLRKEWVKKYDFPDNKLTGRFLDNFGELAENVVAWHLGISVSKLHKAIAVATKQLKKQH